MSNHVVGALRRKIDGRLVVATHNAGKLREMRELLTPFGIEANSAAELGLDEPEETGTTFAANARLKAQAATTRTGLPAFADDSGLSVDALGGEPGIHSARWAGPDRNFTRAMELVGKTASPRCACARSTQSPVRICALRRLAGWSFGRVCG